MIRRVLLPVMFNRLSNRGTRLREVLWVHYGSNRYPGVEREEPGLGNRRNLRWVRHVEHDRSRPLPLVVREEIGRFRFEIGHNSLDGRTESSSLGGVISGLHGNRYSKQHSHTPSYSE